MVQRTESEVREFVGVVKHVTRETSELNGESREQFHVQMQPLDREVKGESGMFHEWLNVPATATETSVPEGSNLDRYLQELEACDPDLAKCESLNEAMTGMTDKSYLFRKKKLGKSYKGFEAKEFFVPIARKDGSNEGR